MPEYAKLAVSGQGVSQSGVSSQLWKILRNFFFPSNLIGVTMGPCQYYQGPIVTVTNKSFLMESKVTGRSWCFTLNNPTEAEVKDVQEVVCKYVIYGEEIGEAGTPHLQGFVVFNKVQRLSGVKGLIPRAHWEVAKGSAEQNIVYCSKDGKTWSSGDPPKTRKQQGAQEKERWAQARKNAELGKMEDIPDDIYVRYYRTLKEIRKDHMQKPEDADGVTGVWLYGPPECGKSRRAREEYPGAYFKAYNKWWDGYQGEDYVILDDFEKDVVLGHHLKIWADRYSFIAETKGGAIHIRPKKFVVTSNYSIRSIFGEHDELCRAIERRFVEVDMTPPVVLSPTSVHVASFKRAKK